MKTAELKNRSISLLLVGFIFLLFNGCGINTTMVGNVNTTQTVVELGSKNFKILDRVSGQAEARYVFGFGGLSEKALNDQAMNDLLSKVDLSGSKALVNVTTERHTAWKFLIMKATVTVSAHIVEFE